MDLQLDKTFLKNNLYMLYVKIIYIVCVCVCIYITKYQDSCSYHVELAQLTDQQRTREPPKTHAHRGVGFMINMALRSGRKQQTFQKLMLGKLHMHICISLRRKPASINNKSKNPFLGTKPEFERQNNKLLNIIKLLLIQKITFTMALGQEKIV